MNKKNKDKKMFFPYFYGLGSSFFMFFFLMLSFIEVHVVHLNNCLITIIGVGWSLYLIFLGLLLYFKKYKLFFVILIIFLITIDVITLFLADYSYHLLSFLLFFLILNTTFPILAIILYLYSKKGKITYF